MRPSRMMLFLLYLLMVPVVVLAQTECPALVRAALTSVETACIDTSRNQACYGNIQLDATPRDGVTDFSFEEIGDQVGVESLQTLQLSPMSLTDESWGVALMQLQADLPDTLPGQNVTFLLFGDVEIENAVSDAPEITLTATGNANVRLRPTTNANNVISSIQTGNDLIANGRLADSSWVQIQVPEDARGIGWVSSQFVDGDVDGLAVIEPGTPDLGPMQAFYFKSGIGDRPCAEAPDSGILVQTPSGAGQVYFNANNVEIRLGSTAYLQAGDGVMTVSVIEGRAIVEADGVSQTVPAGSVVIIPLDEEGLAAGPPEFPQAYDLDALESLPLEVAVLETIEIAPPLSPAQIDEAIQTAQTAGTSGTWSLTSTFVSATNGCSTPGGTNNVTLTFNPDGSATMTTVVSTFTLSSGNGTTYTGTAPGQNSSGQITITLTSPTTFTGQLVSNNQVSNCEIVSSLSGVWISG